MLGGFFRSVVSGIKSGVDAVASGVKKAVQVASALAESVLVKAVDTGEKMISSVAKFLSKISVPIVELGRVAASAMARTVDIVLDVGITVSLAISQQASKLLRKAFEYVNNSGDHRLAMLIKEWCEKILIKFGRGRVVDVTPPPLPPETPKVILLINDLVTVKSSLESVLRSDEVEDLDRYLAVRTAQILIGEVEDKLRNSDNVREISEDDSFILSVAKRIANRGYSLNQNECDRLDKICASIFNKNVHALVFGEMARMWSTELRLDEKKRHRLGGELGKKEAKLKQAKRIRNIGEVISADVNRQLEELEKDVAGIADEYAKLSKEILERKVYVDATEGMLRAYERTIDQVVEPEFQDAVYDRVPFVSNLLIQCMQGGRKWLDLAREDRDELQSFAHIFHQACKLRTMNLMTEVGVEV